MGLELDYQDGQTPLNEDEKDGLLIKTVTTSLQTSKCLNKKHKLNN